MIVWLPTFTFTYWRHLVVKVIIYNKMLFIFSTPVLIRYLWQLKTVVFLLWCQIRVVLIELCILDTNAGIQLVQAILVSLQNLVFAGIFKFQNDTVLDFYITIYCRAFQLSWQGNGLGNFFWKMGKFFPIIGSHWSENYRFLIKSNIN
jgi:hypothetical protein